MKEEYMVVNMTTHKNFFAKDATFGTVKAARQAFRTYADAHPEDKDLVLKHGYYLWQVWWLSEKGTPLFFEEQLSVSRKTSALKVNQRFVFAAYSSDLIITYGMPVIEFTSEGAALNAAADFLFANDEMDKLFMSGKLLMDVREVHDMEVPVLKMTYDFYSSRHKPGDATAERPAEKPDKKKGKKGKKDDDGSWWDNEAGGWYGGQPAGGTKGYKKCHEGNRTILTLGNHMLLAGGTSRGVHPEADMVCIALADADYFKRQYVSGIAREVTGKMFSTFMKATKTIGVASWLDFPLADFQVPNAVTRLMWDAMAEDVMKALKSHDVLAFCVGGHGRTGMFMTIVPYLLVTRPDWTGEKPEGLLADPVKWLRDIYCIEAIDTANQQQYVYDILGLNLKAPEPPKSVVTVVGQAALPAPKTEVTYENSTAQCARCGVWSSYSKTYGVCSTCQNELRTIMNNAKITAMPCTGRFCKHPGECAGYRMGSCGHITHAQQYNEGEVCDNCFQNAAARMNAPIA